jgi:hypothetical protein
MAWRITIVTVLGLLLAGCQDEATPQALPHPNFNPPLVIQAPQPLPPPPPLISPPPPPPPVAIVPRPIRPPVASNVPRDWIPPVEPRPWQWIIIHHSATTYGDAQIIDKWHRDRGFDELGYDFVIGNGTSSGDGQIEVGPRWTKQKYGAHDRTPDNRYNEFGIGICLVGNFDEQHPTAAQMRSVDKLVAYLMKTYHISGDRILGHGDTKPTDCPGKFLSVSEIRRASARLLVDAGDPVEPDSNLVKGQELLRDTPSK